MNWNSSGNKDRLTNLKLRFLCLFDKNFGYTLFTFRSLQSFKWMESLRLKGGGVYSYLNQLLVKSGVSWARWFSVLEDVHFCPVTLNILIQVLRWKITDWLVFCYSEHFFCEVAFFVPLLFFSLEIKIFKVFGDKLLMFFNSSKRHIWLIIEPRRNKKLRNYTFKKIKKKKRKKVK